MNHRMPQAAPPGLPVFPPGPRLVKRSSLPGRNLLPSTAMLTVYVMLVTLLVMTFVVGMMGVGAIRFVFIAGSIGVAWRAWRVSPGMHTEVLIYLFSLAPFLRRVVDSHAGYNASGIMLVGPLLALAIPAIELPKALVSRRRDFSVYAPYGILLLCTLYGWLLSSFQGRIIEAGTETLRTIIPMLYAMYLIQRDDDCEEILQGAARAFLVVSPIMGVYGIFQYLNPPEWDRYWMIYSQMNSIGLPEAMKIRIFSTMNSPASFAMFATCGIMIFSFCRRGWIPFLLVIPIGIALLLSAVRTAWIVLAICVIFCSVFNATRKRAMMLTLCLFGAAAVALLLTPFGDMIGDRLATLSGDPAQDGSGHERLREYIYLYSNMDQYLFGKGMGSVLKDIKLGNIDGQFIESAAALGIFVGNIQVICILWAVVQGLTKIRPNEQAIRLVAAGMVLSYVLVLPLLIVTTGEIAFMFWMFVGILPLSRKGRSLGGLHNRSSPYQGPPGQQQLNISGGRRSSVASQT